MERADEFVNRELDKVARSLYFNDQLPVKHPSIGDIGFLNPKQGFKLRGISSRSWNALLRDEEEFTKNGGEKLKNRIKKYYAERGAITTWDGVISGRCAGNNEDTFGIKISYSTTTTSWACVLRIAGIPETLGYSNIPGGSTLSNGSAGSITLTNPSGSNRKYLVNFGVHHLVATNITMLTDVLVAAGNISTTTTASQTVNSTALTRYFTGEAVYMTFEVTAALGGTGANITVTYTNQGGTGSRSSGAIAVPSNAIVYRLVPVTGGTMVPLQSGDWGVKSVESVQMSASMTGSGVLALLLHKPLVVVPSFSTLTWSEMSAPEILSAPTELVKGKSGDYACLGMFVNPSSTAVGLSHFMVQMVEG